MSQSTPLSICRLPVVDERDNDELERIAIISQTRMYLGLATFHLLGCLRAEIWEMRRRAHDEVLDHCEEATLPGWQTVALYYCKLVTVSFTNKVRQRFAFIR